MDVVTKPVDEAGAFMALVGAALPMLDALDGDKLLAAAMLVVGGPRTIHAVRNPSRANEVTH